MYWIIALATVCFLYWLFNVSRSLKSTKRVKQGVAVVTGANGGIGWSTTLHLLEHGYTVFACDINVSRLEETYKEHERVYIVQMDVTKMGDVEKLKQQVFAHNKGVDALVHVAGIGGKPGPLMMQESKEMHKVLSVNTYSVHMLTRALWPKLLESKGRIIVLTSLLSRMAVPFLGFYCTSKSALEAYCDTLRREVSRLGVKVVVIQPNNVKTDMPADASRNFASWIEQNPDTPWSKHVIGLYNRMLKNNQKRAIPAQSVAECIHYSISTDNPKPRYFVGRFAALYAIVKQVPDYVIDIVFNFITR
mmetsp:Transcript_14065/g.15549  ORF Transcript_14065/g.15549 Transcript_14065/m.15549 type:complete len:305 (-) Transcript_14065:154-1068(-)